jgi:hypothetical protein
MVSAKKARCVLMLLLVGTLLLAACAGAPSTQTSSEQTGATAVAQAATTTAVQPAVATSQQPAATTVVDNQSATTSSGTNGSQTVNRQPATGSFDMVGHTPLLHRGMNAALALYGQYAYVGSRTDGSHPNAGVLVVDIANPAHPEVVYQIGPPIEGNPGETSRELRVWPDQEVLLVLNFSCEPTIHGCTARERALPSIKFFDISGASAAKPKLIATYAPRRAPHEFFLWDDPNVAGRALLYLAMEGSSDATVVVLDISKARDGVLEEVSSWRADNAKDLHSLSLSVDGRRAYVAHLKHGFLILDTSALADGVPNPQITLLTPVENWAQWSGPGAHSAVKVFGKPFAFVTDEAYGTMLPYGGCPWAWTRIIDITQEAKPTIVAEYKLTPYNTREYCDEMTPTRNKVTSFSAHNPTLTKNLAFITWHSGGLQALSIENPLQPTHVAAFSPEPLASVELEDPALSAGPEKVVMWSYPIIQDGLVYAVDIRNGLYILKYRGPFEDEVAEIGFLEGNSNLGEAQLWKTP